MFLPGILLALGVAFAEEASPVRRPKSTPRVYDQSASIVPFENLFGGGDADLDRRDPSGLRAPGSLNRPVETTAVHFLPVLQTQTGESARDTEEGDRRRNWLRPADLLREKDDAGDDRAEDVADVDQSREVGGDVAPLNWQDLREQLPREMAREDAQNENANSSETQSRDGGGAALPQRSASTANPRGQGAPAETTLRVDPVMRASAPAAESSPSSLPAATPREVDRQPILAPAMRMGAVGMPARVEEPLRANPELTRTREAMEDVSRRWDPASRPPVERGFSASPPMVSPPVRIDRPLPASPPVFSQPAEIRTLAPRPEPVAVQPLDIRRFGEEDQRLRPRNEFRGGF